MNDTIEHVQKNLKRRKRKTTAEGAKKSAEKRRGKPQVKRDAAWMEKRLNSTEGLTKGEIQNGWTKAELEKYLRDRDQAVNNWLGFAEGTLPLERIHISSDDYDPHNF